MGTPAQPRPAEDQLAALQAQLKEQGEEVQRLKARPAPVQQVQPQPPSNQPPSKEDIEKMFWKDPLPLVDAIAKRAAFETEQRITANSADTNRAVARKQVRDSDPDVFDKYEVEITNMVGQVQPQFQGNINVWQNALRMIRGEHIDEIVAARMEKAGKGQAAQPSTESSSGDGPARPSTRQPPPPKEKPLTAEQKEVARGLGLDESEYRRGQHRYDNQDTEWSKVVTFSSEDKRRAAAKSKSATK